MTERGRLDLIRQSSLRAGRHNHFLKSRAKSSRESSPKTRLPQPIFISHSTMSSSRTRRIAKEVADIHSDNLSNIKADPVGNGDDLTHLKGSFKGPPGTPYEGGTYTIDVKIPHDYPFRPPVMKFDTKVWHPNVSSQTVSEPF